MSVLCQNATEAEVGSNKLHLLEEFFGVTNTFRVYLKMGTFTLTQVHFLWKKRYFYFVTVGDAPLVTLS